MLASLGDSFIGLGCSEPGGAFAAPGRLNAPAAVCIHILNTSPPLGGAGQPMARPRKRPRASCHDFLCDLVRRWPGGVSMNDKTNANASNEPINTTTHIDVTSCPLPGDSSGTAWSSPFRVAYSSCWGR